MDERLTLNDTYATSPAQSGNRLRRFMGRDWQVGYLFVLPLVLIMAGLIFWPFVSAIFISTTAFNFTTGETFSVGFRNYQRLLSNSDFVLSIQNTVVFTAWSISAICAADKPGATRSASVRTSRTPLAVECGANPAPVSRVAPATTRPSGHATI